MVMVEGRQKESQIGKHFKNAIEIPFFTNELNTRSNK